MWAQKSEVHAFFLAAWFILGSSNLAGMIVRVCEACFFLSAAVFFLVTSVPELVAGWVWAFSTMVNWLLVQVT